MKKLTLGLTVAALALAGTAYAAPGEARRDAPRDGVTTRAEVEARAADTFTRLDVNRDGKIDRSDREQRRASMLDARFDRLDANSDGQLSKSEFASRAALAQGREGSELRHGKGHRRGHGMRHMGMRNGAGHGAGADGAVTQAEFAAAALQRFDRMDANHDGSVTAEERQAMRAEMREHRQERRQGRDHMAPPSAS
jgi:Ca2+-binding EF-hand superfamily protein